MHSRYLMWLIIMIFIIGKHCVFSLKYDGAFFTGIFCVIYGTSLKGTYLVIFCWYFALQIFVLILYGSQNSLYASQASDSQYL